MFQVTVFSSNPAINLVYFVAYQMMEDCYYGTLDMYCLIFEGTAMLARNLSKQLMYTNHVPVIDHALVFEGQKPRESQLEPPRSTLYCSS